MRPIPLLLAAALVGAPSLGAPPDAPAQDNLASGVALVGGPAQYDLAGTGTTGFGALRFELLMSPAVILEPGLTYAPYEPTIGETVHLLIPELQLQLQTSSGRVRPYIGGGIGVVRAVQPGDDVSDFALSAAAGVRLGFGWKWGALGEVRVRAVDPFHGNIVEYTLGLTRRL